MKSICLFSSYFTSDNIPNYVQYYLKELKRHFTRVIFITNEKKLEATSLLFLEINKIEPFFLPNEGYDFGMWYKAMLKYEIELYDRVGLINDSCILFKPLDNYFSWLNKQNVDYAGMVDSTEIVYHIQSFFLTINKKAILPTLQYFKLNGLQSGREDVIKIYELGLCKHLQEQGLKVDAWFPSEKYMPKDNPSIYAAHKMVKDGYPLIKKKILFNSFSAGEYSWVTKHSFNHNPNYYIAIIKKTNIDSPLFDFSLLKSDGYNPDLKKIMSLRLQSFRSRAKNIFLDGLKSIYRKLKIRELRNKLKFSAYND
jgi:lipopolysaccharide biosynthesis protein